MYQNEFLILYLLLLFFYDTTTLEIRDGKYFIQYFKNDLLERLIITFMKAYIKIVLIYLKRTFFLEQVHKHLEMNAQK